MFKPTFSIFMYLHILWIFKTPFLGGGEGGKGGGKRGKGGERGKRGRRRGEKAELSTGGGGEAERPGFCKM